MKRQFLMLILFLMVGSVLHAQDDRLMTLNELIRSRGLSLSDIEKKNPITQEVFNPLQDRYETAKTIYEVWIKEKTQVTPAKPLSYKDGGGRIYVTERTTERWITKKPPPPPQPEKELVKESGDYLVKQSSRKVDQPMKRYVVKRKQK